MKNDKLLHFYIACGITLILSFRIGYLWAVLVVIGLIIGKEIFDKYIKKTFFSIPDIKAGVSGILSGVITYSILMEVLKWLGH